MSIDRVNQTAVAALAPIESSVDCNVQTKEGSLPEPTARAHLCDDAISEIAALLAESCSQDRKSGRILRDAQERAIESQTRQRITMMHEKADAIRTGAIIAGVTGMAAGLVQVAGGCASMSQANQIQTNNMSDKVAACNREHESLSGAYNQLGSGVSICLQSSGSLANGIYQARAEDCDADASSHEASAGYAQRAAERHSDDMRAAKDLMNKATEFLKEVRASQNATLQAAVRG